MRLIDGDDLKRRIKLLEPEYRLLTDDAFEIAIRIYDSIYHEINCSKTCKSKDYTKAFWVMDDNRYVYCSNCKFRRDTRTQNGWKFCPECVAIIYNEQER